MNKRNISLILLLPVSFCLVGVAFAYFLNSAAFSRWFSLGAPPGGAAEILDADAGTIFVRNRLDEVYRCIPCWEKTELLDEPLLQNSYDCSASRRAAPPPPGGAIDRLSGIECYADGNTSFEYAILPDGSVWEWTYTQGAYGVLAYPLFGLAGCALGVMLAAGAVVALKIYSILRKSVAST